MALKPASVLASLTLSGLTLGVFSAALTAGPDSVVRRFLEGVHRQDASSVQRFVWQPIQSPSGSYILALAQRMNSTGRRAQITRRESRGPYILIVTRTEREGGGAFIDQWVLERRNATIKINADLTATQGSIYTP